MTQREYFDGVIGRLDRSLSEFLTLYTGDLDEADQQTLKHHADDLVGVGTKMHFLLEKGFEVPESAERQALKKSIHAQYQEMMKHENKTNSAR